MDFAGIVRVRNAVKSQQESRSFKSRAAIKLEKKRTGINDLFFMPRIVEKTANSRIRHRPGPFPFCGPFRAAQSFPARSTGFLFALALELDREIASCREGTGGSTLPRRSFAWNVRKSLAQVQ